MNPPPDSLRTALENSRRALQHGNRREARHWAMQAAILAPTNEEPWLFLAASAGPHASLAYLKRALEINPNSKRARQGMHWAIQRLRISPQVVRAIQPAATQATMHTRPMVISRSVRQRPTIPIWIPAVLTLLILLLAGLGITRLAPVLAQTNVETSTTASVWLPPAPQPNQITATNPPTETALYITATAAATDTLAASPPALVEPVTPEIVPSQPAPTPLPPTPTPKSHRPNEVGENEFWIEVDLSQQMVYAYIGEQLQTSFLVSTGKAGTPTVTGSYRVYVKYRSADMYGPGYYLSGVPYVMYFYEGYGLHGTYWHNQFGVPASHGCVNLRTEDAAWLFQNATIGTIVRIHK